MIEAMLHSADFEFGNHSMTGWTWQRCKHNGDNFLFSECGSFSLGRSCSIRKLWWQKLWWQIEGRMNGDFNALSSGAYTYTGTAACNGDYMQGGSPSGCSSAFVSATSVCTVTCDGKTSAVTLPWYIEIVTNIQLPIWSIEIAAWI
jgi:hypothetical protein